MMRVLACDTTQAACSIAWRSAQGRLYEDLQEMKRGHAEALLPQLQRFLHKRALTSQHIDRLAVGLGPGSFTGVRVGVAVMRALRLAWGKPLVGVSSLHAMAQFVVRRHKPKDAFALRLPADARHDYVQAFTKKGTPLCEPIKADKTRLIGLCRRHKLAHAYGHTSMGDVLPSIPLTPYPHAADIARLGCELTPCAEGVSPLYLHDYEPQHLLRVARV